MEATTPEPLACPRCEVPLSFAGTKHFHEGTRGWDVMGGVWELFKNRESLDAYFCPRCGRVEFFLAGVGEVLRGARDPGTLPHRDVADADAVPLELAGPEDDLDGDALPEWSCRRCGESVPGNFGACWNCQTPRPETSAG
ncbi:MAG TPA: hypothetical protein VF615_13225 [Longimicrobiaceae bacterium]|jgi:hypothetical protein